MGLFANKMPPALPQAAGEYDPRFMNQLLGVLRRYFTDISAVQQLNVARLNINLDTLPTAETDADLALLRSGDVYRDNASSNVLKIKI